MAETSIAEITKKYRKEHDLTLSAFGGGLGEFGKSFTKQAIHNWEIGASKPNRWFLTMVVFHTEPGDWRHDWAEEIIKLNQ
jgi:DNA-binding transcriptional regulator YiaG